MKQYMAPMEGITGFVFRSAFSKCFEGIDQYFTPFITPKQDQKMTYREKTDILKDNNQGIELIPQILTNSYEGFLKTADELREYGYERVNLNLGCPSRTVVTKGRGSGMLADPGKLDTFLDKIFSGTSMKISVKTRIGISKEDSFACLLDVFNNYPLEELIIHPRYQQDYYNGKVDFSAYETAVSESKNPIGFNGDRNTYADLEAIRVNYPKTNSIMAGRGLLKNPFLFEKKHETYGQQEKERINEFHNLVKEGYQRTLPGEQPVLFHMKELDSYLFYGFGDAERELKKIKKAQNIITYESAVKELFQLREWKADL